jgi:tetratricopeptide (TPR) repeat protein
MRRILPALFLAIVLAAGVVPASADQDDPRLGALFATLKSASDAEAKTAEATIWGIWSESGDPDIDALMEQGMAALATGDPDDARTAFDQVVKQDSSFAEGWNKRATAEFELGDFTASVVDIEHTLELEPRHFGALSGLGEIYLAIGKKPAALKAFEAALAIDPHLDGVKETVEKLKRELAGSPI